MSQSLPSKRRRYTWVSFNSKQQQHPGAGQASSHANTVYDGVLHPPTSSQTSHQYARPAAGKLVRLPKQGNGVTQSGPPTLRPQPHTQDPVLQLSSHACHKTNLTSQVPPVPSQPQAAAVMSAHTPSYLAQAHHRHHPPPSKPSSASPGSAPKRSRLAASFTQQHQPASLVAAGNQHPCPVPHASAPVQEAHNAASAGSNSVADSAMTLAVSGQAESPPAAHTEPPSGPNQDRNKPHPPSAPATTYLAAAHKTRHAPLNHTLLSLGKPVTKSIPTPHLRHQQHCVPTKSRTAATGGLPGRALAWHRSSATTQPLAQGASHTAQQPERGATTGAATSHGVTQDAATTQAALLGAKMQGAHRCSAPLLGTGHCVAQQHPQQPYDTQPHHDNPQQQQQQPAVTQGAASVRGPGRPYIRSKGNQLLRAGDSSADVGVQVGAHLPEQAPATVQACTLVPTGLSRQIVPAQANTHAAPAQPAAAAAAPKLTPLYLRHSGSMGSACASALYRKQGNKLVMLRKPPTPKAPSTPSQRQSSSSLGLGLGASATAGQSTRLLKGAAVTLGSTAPLASAVAPSSRQGVVGGAGRIGGVTSKAAPVLKGGVSKVVGSKGPRKWVRGSNGQVSTRSPDCGVGFGLLGKGARLKPTKWVRATSPRGAAVRVAARGAAVSLSSGLECGSVAGGSARGVAGVGSHFFATRQGSVVSRGGPLLRGSFNVWLKPCAGPTNSGGSMKVTPSNGVCGRGAGLLGMVGTGGRALSKQHHRRAQPTTRTQLVHVAGKLCHVVKSNAGMTWKLQEVGVKQAEHSASKYSKSSSGRHTVSMGRSRVGGEGRGGVQRSQKGDKPLPGRRVFSLVLAKAGGSGHAWRRTPTLIPSHLAHPQQRQQQQQSHTPSYTRARTPLHKYLQNARVRALAKKTSAATNAKPAMRYCLSFCKTGICKDHTRGLCNRLHDPAFVHVCPHWLQGLCKQGLQCPLQHKVCPDLMPVCAFFLQGMCTNEECPYLHVKYAPNTPVCQPFVRGCCPKGGLCPQQHLTKKMARELSQQQQPQKH